MRALISRHRALAAVLLVSALLSLIPQIQSFVVSEGPWRGMPLPYADESIYYTHMKEVATGNLFFGSSYYLEHRYDPPVAILGSSILAALPMLLGLPILPTLALNFILWGALLIVLVYVLLRELAFPKMLSALASLFLYAQSYDLVFRASVRQQVFPFLILFYIALLRFLKSPGKSSAILLGIASGISFYIYGFLWQLVVVTLGLHFLYMLWRGAWKALRAASLAYVIAAVIGAPPFLYTLFVAHHPLFWESARRFGVVVSHLPMGEVLYSGSFVLLILLVLGILYTQVPALRNDRTWRLRALFLAITGLALFVHQASNVITGAHFEIGEHVRRFIIPWLSLATALVLFDMWRVRATLRPHVAIGCAAVSIALIVANLWFLWVSARRFFPGAESSAWKDVQAYVGPYAWLQANEPEPVVVWGDPHNYSTIYLPAFTRHYVLHTETGKLTLLSDEEFRERYLVSQYFERPDAKFLKSDMPFFLGRADTFHEPMSRAREVKVCRLLRFFVPMHECGEAPTAVSLLGESFFEGLSKKLEHEIRPHIKDYLATYHVSYILKDVILDPEYDPASLGAYKVYEDGRFELYALSKTENRK